MEIRGKVAIVTGAGKHGSGRAEAKRLAPDGAAVVVNDIDEPAGRATVRHIVQAGGRAAFSRADEGKEAEVQAMTQFAEASFRGLDALVNIAFAPYEAQGPLSGWHAPIQVDLLGAMYGILHGVEAMRRRGGGAIVNVSSTSALGHGRKHSKSPAYDVAKAGVLRLTTTLAWLKERENIRVNCIVPDWVASE